MGVITGYILIVFGVIGCLTSLIKHQLSKHNTKPVVSGITTIQQVKSVKQDDENDDSEYNNYNRINLNYNN